MIPRQYARSLLGIVRTTWQWGTDASSVVSSHCVQLARRLTWQPGQKYRHVHEKANRYSCAQDKESPGPFQPCVPYTNGHPAWAAHA